MFYVELPKIRKRPEVTLVHILPAIIIFAAFMVVTLWSWNTAKQRSREDINRSLNTRVEESASTIEERMRAYEEILRAGSGLFMASDQVGLEEWKNYVNIFDLRDRYQGILGLGYVEVIRPGQLAGHLEAVRTFRPDYTITPEGNRDRYTSIVYYEPSSPTTVFGYDQHTESNRAGAMDFAEKTGQVSLTPLVYPVNDYSKSLPSFFMYYPIYTKDSSPTTEQGRENNIAGFVFAPFRVIPFFEGLQNKDDTSFAYRVSTGENNANQKMYETANFAEIDKQPNKHSASRTIELYNQKWHIDYVARPDIGTPELRQRPTAILISGFTFSFIIALCLYAVLASRTKVLAYDEEAKIQGAKDELLALASHQLRTPATGVKQYVGMLRDGFAGPVSKEQKELLNRAYESNERQLKTVSQMLSVARIDTDRLHLEPIDTNVSTMLSDVIAEQKKTIDEKRQKITRHIARNVHAEIDRHNFRMVLENVINNASKYTPNKGKIWVSLTDAGDSLTIVVRDTGVGITRDDLPLLFKKFVRIPNKLTKKVSGSGLGLYLAKNVVESHAGEITLEAHQEKGSVVTITIPKKQP